ncbi:TMEM43 family protein [Nodularia harveyana UHCC-0300]|uniref:TMEM43 family protein n=1 Tax=Nodularia harveyana UHCC-0300 TaxID=2974287 RepID=A0ABU5UDT3_9CYAN|nr:TMEM43 family protein [Nodularia harveyana]MEA5581663.1 TMEM43 family protein [Nodularia harveyana UHCC-0300]
MSDYDDDQGDFNQYVEYREVSWGTRIKQAVQGIVIGILSITIAFGLIIWNEGSTILNQAAQQAISIPSDVPNNQDIGKLIITSGVITSDETLGDNLFIQPGEYIALAREVDMYSWVEKQTKETETNLGGSQDQKVTTTYYKTWVSVDKLDEKSIVISGNPINSNSQSFVYPEKHQNPTPNIKNAAYKVNAAKIGVFDVDMSSFSLPRAGSVKEAYGDVFTGYVQLPTPTQLQVSEQNLIPKADVTNVGSYLYQGSGTLQTPNLGDLRMRYAVFPANIPVTVIGKLSENNKIVPYLDKNKRRLFRLFPGTETNLLGRIQTEDHIFTWGLRFLSFLAMWIGLRLILEPINVVLDFIPIFGAIGRLTTGFSTMIVALMINISTIVIYHLTQNLLYLAIAVIITFLLGNAIFGKRYQRR